MRMWLLTGLVTVGVASGGAARLTDSGQSSQGATDADWCEDAGRGDRDRAAFCEVREFTMSGGSVLRINDNLNGSISVTGSSRSDMRIRARVVTRAATDGAARSLASRVTVSADGGRVTTDGPRNNRNESWNVSFRAEVPRATNLDLNTTNGSVSVVDVRGDVSLDSTNGSLRLSGTGGDVTGRTTNGSVRVSLSGTAWNGDGLDVRTSNGSVNLEVPENYNARLVVGTRNGSLRTDIPLTVQGRLSRELDTTLGSGGATIRVTTSNGSVRLGRPPSER